MLIFTAVISSTRHVLVAYLFVARYVDLSQVEFLALVPRLCLDELLGYVGPVAHPALHYSLHESESLLSCPVLMDQGILERVVDEVLAVTLVLDTLFLFALEQAVQTEDYGWVSLARHVFDFD